MARDVSESMSAATPPVRALHLAVVWAFAVVQPLLDLIGRFPTFLVAHGIEGAYVVVVVVLLLLPVPAVLFFFTRLARLFHRSAEEVLHLLLIGLGVGLGMLLVVRRFNIESGLLATAIALLAAAAVTWVYWRHAAARTAMSIAGVGLLVFPAFFLMAPGVGAVINFRGAPSVAGVEVSRKIPVFLVIFDELPTAALLDEDEQIDAGRFPAFAALAREGMWFQHAFTVSDFTIQAVPAILTGRYVSHDQVPTAADHPESIFTLLGGSYRILASEPMTQICPTSLCSEEGASRWGLLFRDLSVVYLHLVVPGQWTGALPPVSGNWAGFGRAAHPEPSIVPSSSDAEDTPAWRKRWKKGARTDQLRRFEAVLASIDERQGALYVIHSLLPHSPYSYLPSGQRYDLRSRVSGLQSGRWVRNPWVVAEAEKRHLLQVGFVDHLLGRLVSRLKSVGVYDRALIVIVADHGSSFVPGSRQRNLTETNWGEIIPVPLLIKLPGRQEGRVIDRPVETVDILPTIADVVGAKIPWSVDGHSLLAEDHAREVIRVNVRGKNRGVVRRPAAELISAARIALSHRLARWGSGNWERVLRYGPRPSLVGIPLSELSVVGEIDGVRVASPERFLDVDLEGGFLPAMARGYVTGAAARARRVELAVAVNGTIRVTTVAYRENRTSKELQWDIVLGKESLRTGDNLVEVFIVNGPKAAPRLLRAWSTGAAGESKNLALADTGLWGMEVSGFYENRWESPYRWTNGKARLRVPIDRQKPPHTIRIDIAWTGPQHSPFRVLVDGCELIRVPQPAATWSESLDLGRCSPSGDDLTIELLSETFVPKEILEGNPDARTLGLAMNGIWLLND